jgi:predicted glycosyltransferase
LAGVNATSNSLDSLAAIARSTGEGQIHIERARADFADLLARCAVSISQAGYNTMMEIVQAGARAVVVPFAGGAEVEQTLRARSFAEKGLIGMLEEDALTPEALAGAIDQAVDRARPSANAIDLGGAARTAELVGQWAADYQW